jgi:hypothetical protein
MKCIRPGEIFRGVGRWLGAKKVALVAIALIIILVIPQLSQSQFLPSPCCAILSAGLSSIGSAISNVIGGDLNGIDTTMSAIDAFERTVVWPPSLISQAKAVVGALHGIFVQIRGIEQIQLASATLPDTQQLEQILLSADSTAISALDARYAAVYSSVPPQTDASPEVRDLIDMTDAAAQAAMKRAIAIDTIADLEMQAADRITQEVQTAAPGSAPILEAGAAAWLVRANAYTQAALTELMRLRAVDLATAGAEMKLDAQRGVKLRGNVTDAMKRN